MIDASTRDGVANRVNLAQLCNASQYCIFSVVFFLNALSQDTGQILETVLRHKKQNKTKKKADGAHWKTA